MRSAFREELLEATLRLPKTLLGEHYGLLLAYGIADQALLVQPIQPSQSMPFHARYSSCSVR